jgi:lysyl-tRNA synthetase class 2
MEPAAEPAATDGADDAGHGLDAIRAARYAKVDALQDRGTLAYPYRYDRTHTLGELRARWGGLEAGSETTERVSVAGRLLLRRRQGKLAFGTIHDRGDQVQLFVSKAVMGEESFAAFDEFDLGDHLGAEGTVMATRTGELSVKVDRVVLLAKAVRPMPDKWRGLTDTDTRFRQRYADLIVNPDARRAFEVRHRAIASIRRTLDGLGFVEVETPVLHAEAGGAHARPFVTHHNALELDLFLRIALELHLKRLIVGGLERVYEIGRVFRNEGLSPRHNPEFTMLELYWAYGDWTEVMEATELLVTRAAADALGTTVVDIGGTPVDLAEPWRRASMYELIEEHLGVRVHPSRPIEELRDVCHRHGVAVEAHMGTGALCMELYDELVERHLSAPTFVTGHPVEVSPLARVHRDDPWITERFELVVNGRELANGYSELNDPRVQRARFEDEQRAKEAGNLEAGTVDEDYLRALEYGMPPTGGLGIGIDRLAMLLAGVSTIRDVILFPTLRPEVS